MTERRMYPERTQLYVKDVNDQYPGKYLAFVVNSFGEKQAFTCDNIELGPGAVIFSRSPVVVPVGEKPKNVVVVACGIKSDWTFIERERFLELTGREYEENQIADGKARKAVLIELFGEKALAQVLVTPDGKQIAIPADEEAKARFECECKKAAQEKYDDSVSYN